MRRTRCKTQKARPAGDSIEVISMETSEEGSPTDVETQKEDDVDRLSNLAYVAEQLEKLVEEIPQPKVTPIRPPSSLRSLSISLTFYRQWEIERDRLQGVIDKQQREIEKRDNKIKELEAKVDTITSMVPELMQCRAPTRVYALHLRERYLNFKLNHIVRDLSPSLETPEEFYDTYQTSPAAVKKLLCEFYLHNYFVASNSE